MVMLLGQNQLGTFSHIMPDDSTPEKQRPSSGHSLASGMFTHVLMALGARDVHPH